jgi:septal ring factor EnvC (AmiA/AmiB activator)
MDVQTILLSVEERDKWSRRLETLRATLAEVRRQRQRLERQLKTVKRELSHLTELADAMVDPGRRQGVNRSPGTQDRVLLPR